MKSNVDKSTLFIMTDVSDVRWLCYEAEARTRPRILVGAGASTPSKTS